MSDNVNHPGHYTQGGIECIDAIQSALTPEEFRGYCKGNALKYVWRERLKNGAEDLRKAKWYIEKMNEANDSRQRAKGRRMLHEAVGALRQRVRNTALRVVRFRGEPRGDER